MGYRRGVRFTRDSTRLASWTALLLGLLAAAVPLATGDWDPAWLRVAKRPVLDVSTDPRVALPDVPARFTAHGPAAEGVTWTLTGERVVAVEPPLVHALVAPRLVVRRGDEVLATLAAARGEVRLPRPGEERGAHDDVVQVRLEGGVEVVRGDVTMSTERMSVALDPARPADPAGAGARLTAPGPVVLRLGPAGRRLTAAAMEARLAPLRLDLAGPVDLEDPGGLPGRTGGGPLRGRAARATLEGEGEPRAARLDARSMVAPERLVLRLEQVELGAQGGGDVLACDALRLSFLRAPSGARAALGGHAGSAPSPELSLGPASYALDRATASGHVRLRAVPDPAAPDAAVTLLADEVTANGPARRVVARGRPARVEDDRGGWLEAPTISLASAAAVDAGRAVEVVADGAEREVRFALAEPARATAPGAGGAAWRGTARRLAARLRAEDAGASPPDDTRLAALARVERLELAGADDAPATIERDDGATRVEARVVAWDVDGPEARLAVEGAPAVARVGAALTGEAPWRVRARRVHARVDRAALASLEPGAGDVAVLGSAAPFRVLATLEAAGEVDVRREGSDSPARHVALAGERLTWSRAARRVDLQGAPAEVTVGEATLRAPALDLDVASGEARASGPCVLEVPDARGPVTVHAARAAGRFDLRPAAWREATEARRAARRQGARYVLPGWLLALELAGDDGDRVRAAGPDGLSAAADRVAWDAARGVARLEALEGGPPVRLALRGTTLEAPRVLVRPGLAPGRAHARVDAGGGVRVEGPLPGSSNDGERLALACGWLSADVWEPWRGEGAPPEGSPARSPLGALRAGGEGGVVVDGSVSDGAGGQVPVRLRADRLEGDGVSETLRLAGAPDRPVLVARGDLALEAPAARMGFERAGQALRLALEPPWTCRLPPLEGQAAGAASGKGPVELLLEAPTSGAQPGRDPAELARRLLALEVEGGVEVVTPSLRARADRVSLVRPGELVLRGDPVEVTRGGVRSRGLEQVLRLEELTGRQAPSSGVRAEPERHLHGGRGEENKE